MTSYALHGLTTVLGPAARVIAISGLVLPRREFVGRQIDADIDDNSIALVDLVRAQLRLCHCRRPDVGVHAHRADARRPGNLVAEAETLRTRLSQERGSGVLGASALTAAELHLLPLLSTHLTFPEIAEELFLSRNTIKSQASSIYRKLGTSTGSQAITRSRELGLLEG
jgi:DNA-binding NarL/FixJ family response regulator